MAEHTGGMIALVPSAADLDRLAVAGGDPADQLHLTLAYLGDDVTGLDADARDQLTNDVSAYANATGPVAAEVMGHAQFNPDSDQFDPCAVYLVSGEFERDTVTGMAARALGAAMPDQHAQFIPHVTAGYDLDVAALTYTGPVTFDRVRLALGNDVTDFPLGKENTVTDDTMADRPGIPVRFPVLAVEGLPTSDGRYIDAGALTTRPLPLPILAQTQTPVGGGGHDGAHVIGRLDKAERVPGPSVVSKVTGKPFPEGTFVWTGSGTLDPDAPATKLVKDGYLTGNSVDLSEIEAFIEDDPTFVPEENPEGVKIGGQTGERMRIAKGTIAATTLVAIPAFADAYTELDGQTVQPVEGLAASATPTPMWRSAELGDDTCLPCALANSGLAPMVASGAGEQLPPVGWFRDPELPDLTPLTVGPDGRVYGHLAGWTTCHTSYAGTCVLAPRSGTDYAYFRTGARRVLGDDGEPAQIGIGKLTVVLDPNVDGHADAKLGAIPAAAHYDNVATAVADVEIGEDAHGIWVAGAVRASATQEQVDALMASPLSGDWRPVNGRLELVAALAVNTGGFPVPRARVASGQVLSLVAAGAVPRQPVPDEDALAERIAARVVRELKLHVPRSRDDDATDALAARQAAALASWDAAELADRRAAALADIDDDHLYLGDLDDWVTFGFDPLDQSMANWVSKAGGLPKYIKRIATHLKAKGMEESRAIATAVNAAKKMCATGDVSWPGRQKINPGSRAEACNAVKEWEAKKAAS